MFCGGTSGASKVAKAFYAGKTLRRGNHRTDGSTYFLFDHPIAKRCDLTDAEKVSKRLLTGKTPRALEFSLAGHDTATTRSALGVLGIRASKKDSQPFFDGKPVDSWEWYTLEEIAALPFPPEKVRRTRFVQMTAPLFG